MQQSPSSLLYSSSFSSSSTAAATAATVVDVASSSSPANEAETYFLIARFLASRSETSQAAVVLKKQLAEHRMLGNRIGWDGCMSCATYDDFDERFPSIPEDQLAHVIRGYLTAASRPQGFLAAESIVVAPRTESSLVHSSSLLLPTSYLL